MEYWSNDMSLEEVVEVNGGLVYELAKKYIG